MEADCDLSICTVFRHTEEHLGVTRVREGRLAKPDILVPRPELLTHWHLCISNLGSIS